MLKTLLRNIDDARYIHVFDPSIPGEYKEYSIHIALERADSNKDWSTFKLLYKLAPEFLFNHLRITSSIFDYNYLRLPEQDRTDLFS